MKTNTARTIYKIVNVILATVGFVAFLALAGETPDGMAFGPSIAYRLTFAAVVALCCLGARINRGAFARFLRANR